MRITKAYTALTDDEARKNWELYGNPDGPGATSFGIALPSWIVEKENSILVLGLYALVFMVALPTVVGIWWYRSVKYGQDQVLLDTTQIYYYYITGNPHMMLKRVLMIISCSVEFHKKANSEVVERPSDNIEVPKLMKELPNLGEKNRDGPLGCGYSVKARALIFAHLSRIKLPPNTLELDKSYVVKKCPILIQEFVQCVANLTIIALAGRVPRIPHLDTLENAMKLSRLIVQALWDNKSPLLQLPHITEESLRYFTSRKQSIRNIHQLAAMQDEKRRSMLRNITDEHYLDIMMVMSKMPLLDVEVRSEVLDDEDSGTITARAIVTVTVTLTRQPLSVLFDQSSDQTNEQQDYEAGDCSENCELIGNGNVTNNVNNPLQAKPRNIWSKNKKKKKTSKQTKSKRKAPGSTFVGKENTNQVSQTANAKVNNVQSLDKKVEKRESTQESNNIDKKEADKEPESNDEKDTDDLSDEEEWDKFQQRVFKKEKVLETKSKKSHSVHCPYFPDGKQEYWWIYLVDRKKHVLMTAPVLMTNLVTQEEIELKFTAPPKPGIYNYSVVVRSDSYIDFDVIKNIKFDVKQAKEIKDHPQWDIPEDEEATKEEDSAVEDSDLIASDDDDNDDDSDGYN
jgi:translocation protein SEC63-like protein